VATEVEKAVAIRVNREALEHAENLIKGRQYEKESEWSQAQPSADEENEFIDENGWKAFARWHLAYDSDEPEETKKRYRFPFGDFKMLHRSALVAAKQRAGQQSYDNVERAADELLEKFPSD